MCAFQKLDGIPLNALGHSEQHKCNLLVLTVLQITSKRAISWHYYLSSKNSQNHKEWWGLEGTSGDDLVQAPCRSRVTYSRLHRTLSRWGLSISREGDSTTSLGNLCQGSITLRVKKFFLMFAETSCASVCTRCPLSSPRWAPLKTVWPHPPDTHH